MSWIQSVNNFWFRELKSGDWFSGRKEVDELIRARFGVLYEELKKAPPEMNSLTDEGFVAIVIAFDQFPRNLFRESPDAYATDSLALTYTERALKLHVDERVSAPERHFLYMPFMHSEDRAMQARSLELFGKLGDADVLRFAEHHKRIVDRFGRFPHRNKILGRESTNAEIEFLEKENHRP